MKIMKKSLAMLLVLCMLISMVPLNVLAASATSEAGTAVTESEGEENDFIKVFHLDCGRKYFTVDQVKELIDSLSNVGFSHMELAIGNDGLRLLLDDMSISANGTTYASETVKSGIKTGNIGYSHSGEWTQSDMDTIISYAATKGIEIIPLVNNPGHMDSILAAMKACGIDGYYKSSARTVDLENAEAVAFTQALVMKYANYFADKGCKYFNIGADEYANDYHTSDSTGMGFGYLVTNKKYGNFVTYINTLVENICALGMTPIAFNDGIYYNSTTSQGTFDTRLVVAAWTGGWGGIKPATTTFLEGKGHQILNTNERWYYVPSASSGYTYNNALSNAKSVSVTTVTDNTGATPMGAMQCVWFDYPNVDYATYKSNVMTLINTLAENNPTYFTGPNEPLVPESVTKTDEETKIAVTAPGLTGLTINVAEAPEITGAIAGKVLAWDITPATDDGNYVGEATVSIPVPADWKNVRGGVLASANGEEVMGIKGKLENGVFTFTVPHFSTVVAYEVDASAIEYDEEIVLTVGEAHSFVVDGSDLSGNAYIPDPEGIADVEVSYEKVEGETTVTLGNQITPTNSSGWSDTGVIKSGNYYLVMSNNGTLSATTDVEEATVFTVTRSSSSRWTIRSGSYYLRYNNSNVSGSTSSYEWRYNNGFYRSSYMTNYYLNYNNNWTTSSNANSKTYLYDITTSTTAPVDKSTVTFKGVAPGETYVTIEDIVYKIIVNKRIESAMISIGDTLTYNDSSTSAPVIENSSVATATINNGVLTITAKAEGTTKVITDNGEYTITVIPFNPDTVSKVPVFLWITSHPIDANGISSLEISAGDLNVYSAEGAKLTDLIPFTGKDPQNETNADTICNLWQVRLQHEGAKQTSAGSDDKTAVGEQVEYIRYYGGKWQVKDTSGTWLDVAATDQLTAYYLQKSPLTDEVDSLVKDWGFQFKDGQKYWQYFDESSYAALSAQVIYEDGSMNPDTKANNSDAPLIDTTVFFNFWAKGQDGHTANRDIGYFLPQFNEQYEIYKITTMHGSCSVTARSDNASAASVNYGNPDPNDEEEVIVWQIGDGTPELIGKDGNDALQWRNSKDAILIRIYLRAKVTEDSLNVVYYDEKFGDELYSYNISVDAGVNFTNDITPKPGEFEGNSDRIDVTNCTIQNKNEITQYFQTDLTMVPEAKGKYNSDLYEYTGSEISEDGKTLYLYYNIDTGILSPMFVVDYGRPFTFSLSQVVREGQEDLVESVTVGGKTRYGTLKYNADTQVFTYTPTQVLPNIDVLTINIKFAGEPVATTNAGVLPATTVDYEEGFATLTGFTGGSKGTVMQNAWEAGTNPSGDVYGYDSKVIEDDNTVATSTVKGDTAEFAFTGTGVDLYVNSDGASGNIAIQVRNADNRLVKVISVKTTSNSTITGAFNNTYQEELIAASVTGLAYGQYSVKITTTDPGTDGVYFDGFRVYGTMQDQDNEYYTDDFEDNPMFLELRDYVLGAVDVSADTSVDYEGTISNVEVYEQILKDVEVGEGKPLTSVVLNNGTWGYTAQELLDNGPKNELFLLPGQSVVFNLTTAREVQVGLKAVNGTAKVTGSYNGTITSGKDMFYTVAEKVENAQATEKTVTITNDSTSTSILSITKVKICDDPNAVFGELEADDLVTALESLGFESEKKEPECANATLNIALNDESGNVLANIALTANGVVGETNTFSATAIEDAVATLVPEGYELKDATYTDQNIAYGEEETITFTAEKIVEEPETSLIGAIASTIKKLLNKFFGWL